MKYVHWCLITLILRLLKKPLYHFEQHISEKRKLRDEKWQEIQCIHNKDISLRAFHNISWGKLSPVSYSGSMRGSRLHITFTQHRFQGCSVQVFLSGLNEFVYWAKAGHATRTCWKQRHSKEPVFILCESLYITFVVVVFNMNNIKGYMQHMCTDSKDLRGKSVYREKMISLTSVKINKSKTFSIL